MSHLRVPQRFFDIGGHDLGCPARVVAVRTKQDLRAALAEAAAEQRPLAAMGLRATYWHNLSIDGAVVADLAGYDRIVETNTVDGYVTVESGISLRRLDEHLRAHGGHLPMHPDAYGDTPVGSAFANGVTAGIGMLWGSFADQVLGLEVMLADGSTVQIGASRMLRGKGGPIGQGLPDLRSLFFGAEGAVGVVTEIDLALIPPPWEARLSWQVEEDRFEQVLASGLHWRRRGCVETMRWLWTGTGEARGDRHEPRQPGEARAARGRGPGFAPGLAGPSRRRRERGRAPGRGARLRAPVARAARLDLEPRGRAPFRWHRRLHPVQPRPRGVRLGATPRALRAAREAPRGLHRARRREPRRPLHLRRRRRAHTGARGAGGPPGRARRLRTPSRTALAWSGWIASGARGTRGRPPPSATSRTPSILYARCRARACSRGDRPRDRGRP